MDSTFGLELSTVTSLPAHTDNYDSDLDNYVTSRARALLHEDPPITVGPRNVQELFEFMSLELVKIFSTDKEYQKFLAFHGEAAKDILDLLQKMLDHGPIKRRKLFYVALVRLCRKSADVPRCFTPQNVSPEYMAQTRGGHGDIYKGVFEKSGQIRDGKNDDKTVLCLKRLETSSGSHSIDSEAQKHRLVKTFIREAVTWGQLLHPNILPFFGIYRPVGNPNAGLYLVSPWVENGHILNFLGSKDTQQQADRPRLISGIANGLKYLHDNGVVHGNLKCSDILVVAEKNQTLITDFGLAYVSDAAGLNGDAYSSTRLVADPGRDTFVAPEHRNNKERRTCASDMFNFGLVCYQIFTTPSVSGVPDVRSIHRQILDEHYDDVIQRPKGPEFDNRKLTDEIWNQIVKCLSVKPEDRPGASDIVGSLPQYDPEFKKLWKHPSESRDGFDTSSRRHDDILVKAYERMQTPFSLPSMKMEELCHDSKGKTRKFKKWFLRKNKD
ncbi:hypothetical protein H0H92_001835 [Tricholoma furcatifolium]|nr:hypothetical protein H0H92_001835 [Tricholoma furcatifolium]